MEETFLLHGILRIKFTINSKVKHKIKAEKHTAINDIDIKQVSAKHFFE